MGLISKLVFYSFGVFVIGGTFLHEASHAFIGRCVGEAEGLSIVPRIEGNRFVFGSVRAKARFGVLSLFIAIAPLLWWVVLFLVLKHLHVIEVMGGSLKVHFVVFVQMFRSFSVFHMLFLWLLVQMLWAGSLSSEDIMNAIRAVLSLSGLILISGVWILLYCWRHFGWTF